MLATLQHVNVDGGEVDVRLDTVDNHFDYCAMERPRESSAVTVIAEDEFALRES
jgi:hypothetical protein